MPKNVLLEKKVLVTFNVCSGVFAPEVVVVVVFVVVVVTRAWSMGQQQIGSTLVHENKKKTKNTTHGRLEIYT